MTRSRVDCLVMAIPEQYCHISVLSSEYCCSHCDGSNVLYCEFASLSDMSANEHIDNKKCVFVTTDVAERTYFANSRFRKKMAPQRAMPKARKRLQTPPVLCATRTRPKLVSALPKDRVKHSNPISYDSFPQRCCIVLYRVVSHRIVLH